MNAHALTSSDWRRPVIYYFGGALTLIGLATIILGGISHWTAFIPLALGLAVLLAGYGARSGLYGDGAASLIVAIIGAVALTGTVSAVPQLSYALVGSPEIGNAGAVISRAATALVTIGSLLALAGVTILRKRG